MNINPDGTFCSACGALIDLALDTLASRAACLTCGATARTMNVSLTESVTARDGIGVKAKRRGQKKPYVEDLSVPSFSVSKQKPVHHQRVIDRDNDRYTERVVDYETGEVIHECDEPLSVHTGHGSNRTKPGKNGG